jgi:hypothetical protein
MSKPASKLAVKPTVIALEVVDDVSLGAELTSLYHEANDGFRRVLRFGAAFLQVEHRVTACDTVLTRGKASGKFGVAGSGMKGWLAKYAPEVGRPTAYKYRDITEALALKFKIADPALCFAADITELPPAEQAKRAKAIEYVSGRSLSGVQLELGLVTRAGGDTRSAAARAAQGKDAADPEAPIAWPKALPFTSEEDRARFEKMPNAQRLAWLEWMPRMRHLQHDLTKAKPLWPHLDKASREDLIATFTEGLSLLSPRAEALKR